MQQLLFKLATANPRTIQWGLLAISLVFALLITQIQIDTDPENMLPSDNPAKIFHNLAKRNFAIQDAIVVGMVNPTSIYTATSLAELHLLSEYVLGLDGVYAADVMSLATVDNIAQTSTGEIHFEWMMKQPPKTSAEADYIKAAVTRLPLLYNTIVSEDHKAAAIYVPIKSKDLSYALAQKIQSKIDTLASENDWHITGLPVAEDRFGHEMFIQMAISAPLAGLMIFALLWLFFRNISFVTAPMLVAMATVVITMGSLIGMGFTVHIMSSMIAIFLMPIAVVDSVHIMSTFADRYRQGDDSKQVITEVVGHLFTPMLFTSVTSAVGFLSLTLTPIPPVQIFGAFVGCGILLAFILTIVFIPAYLVTMSQANLDKLALQAHKDGASQLERSVKWIGEIALKRSKLWLALFTVILIVSAYGISLIQINDNPVRWFKSDHELRVADRVLNQHFAGTYDAHLILIDGNSIQNEVIKLVEVAIIDKTLNVNTRLWLQTQTDTLTDTEKLLDFQLALDDFIFEQSGNTNVLSELLTGIETLLVDDKPFLSPVSLRYIEKLQAHLLASGLAGKSNSLADVVKVVNRELNSGKNKDYQLPNSHNAVAQTLMQYQSSHRPEDLWHFVSPDYKQSLIWLQLSSGDNQNMSAVINEVESFIKSKPLPQGMSYHWAGKTYINVVWQEAMVTGMINSLVGAFIMVFIMMAVLFRSLTYGLLAMLPLSLTITFIYGLIGWIGKDYDMPIAVLSALTLGLSVDFAIHFLEQYRASLAKTHDVKQSLREMFAEPGRAIARNAIVIAIGFTPLLFAPLVPYITVGVFLASIMAISALITIVMLPALINLVASKNQGNHS